MVMNVAASAPVVSAARSDVSERRARRRRLWRGRRHGREGVGPSAYCPLHVATKAGLHGLRVVYCTPHPARPPKDFLSFDLVGNHSHILGIPVRIRLFAHRKFHSRSVRRLFLMMLGLAMLLAVALHPTRLRTTLRPSCRLIVALDLFPSLPEGLDADQVLYRACVATVQATCPCAS